MKRFHFFFLVTLTALATACNQSQTGHPAGTGQPSDSIPTGQAEESSEAAHEIRFETTDTIARFRLDSLNQESPCMNVEIHLETAAGTDAVAQNINTALLRQTANHLASTEETLEGMLSHAGQEYKALLPDYRNELDEGYNTARYNHQITLTGKSSKGRQDIINYTIDYYEYTGGAHPNHQTVLLNFDNKKGQRLQLSDVFQENALTPLKERILNALGKQLGTTTLEEINDCGFFNIEDLQPTENFLLEKDSIVFLYNIYEIAPYARGTTRIAVGYDDLKDLLK